MYFFIHDMYKLNFIENSNANKATHAYKVIALMTVFIMSNKCDVIGSNTIEIGVTCKPYVNCCDN